MKISVLKSTSMVAMISFLASGVAAYAQPFAVTTQHYDNWRTGWNYSETTLNPVNVASSKFGQLYTVKLDYRVAAQPIIIPNQKVECPPNQVTVNCKSGLSGTFEVAYVATENNTLYAIDATTGNILLTRNFGPANSLPYFAYGFGIHSTPVVDTLNNYLYLVSHASVGGVNTVAIHALNLNDLTDAITPYTIPKGQIQQKLSDGTTYTLNPELALSFAGLVWANGNIYAALKAYGEFEPALSPVSRGWVLGFKTHNLQPISSLLTDSNATSTNNYFISSIWMSGSAPAADAWVSPNGSNLYFSTGNSDPSGTSLGPNNIEESVVKVNSNLQVVDSFTPYNYATLDAKDEEIGSGGVLKIPTNWFWYTPPSPSLVVTAGKDGRLFLLNANHMGGYTPGGPDNVLDVEQMEQCWCAPSFFTGPDKIGRVVTSGGNKLITWKVVQTPTSSKLVKEASATIPWVWDGRFEGGFFTSVSSNGTGTLNTGIIWAVARPTKGSNAVTLYAYASTPSGGNLNLIFQGPAGVWNGTNNPNIIPVVANGRVYVASDKILTVFGVHN